MLSAENVIGWVEITAVSFLVCYLVGLGIGALRAWRLGQSGVAVAAWFTVALTGLGFALTGAWAGSRFAFTVARSFAAPPLMSVFLQVAGALLCSELAHRLFSRQVAGPLGSWFRGEGAGQLGG